MTVKELIEVLTTMPFDAKVFLWEACIYTDEFDVKLDKDGDVVIER